jgi:CDK-activating kinase assembly factor MAT1
MRALCHRMGSAALSASLPYHEGLFGTFQTPPTLPNMSRTAARSSAVARRPGEDDGKSLTSTYTLLNDRKMYTDYELELLKDICPVCKSSRYLNPDMRFKVNPVCYHKMCESCVDRIFSQGPAPCPVAGCGQTLRKARFRAQTFEDIQVEKEVDVRREVAKT